MPSSAAPQSDLRSGAELHITADDRLLVEAMLAQDRLASAPIDDPSADDAARRADGEAERMLAVRARSMRSAPALIEALRNARQVMGVLVSAGVVLAVLGGAAAARAALGSPRNEPVNFFHVIGVLLGLQTLVLLIWLYALTLARRSANVTMAAASFGGLIMALARRLVQWTHKGVEHTAAIAAISSMLMRGSLGKWTFSAISNGLWLAFNVGCLVMIIALLSTRQYAFAWETTILSSGAYVPLTSAVASMPRLVGFTVPNSEQIETSQWTGDGAAFAQATQTSQAWSSLLVGSLIVYGFGPRLLLLALSLGQRRSARNQFRVNMNQPEAVRILERLAPASSNLGVIDSDDAPQQVHEPAVPRDAAVSRPVGPPAILAFEIERPQAPWPPPAPDVKWHDLGFVDGRDDRHRVLSLVRQAPVRPRAVVIVCGLPNTPDRGAENFLRELSAAASAPLVMLLTGGHHLRERVDSARLEQRVTDWRSVGASAGVSGERVIELDLDHFTHESLIRLTAIVAGSEASPGAHERQVESAFNLIAAFAQRVIGQSNESIDEQRLKLHQDIAVLYRPRQESWQQMLRIPRSISISLSQQIKGHTAGDLAAALQSSAARFTQFLPERLKRSPKWLASGAAAGALGCIAAAALISPVAIGALPLWSAIGAAIAAAVQTSVRLTDVSDTSSAHNDLESAVRAAALFALVLELQGRDEIAITRILDAAVPDDDHSSIVTASQARAWLDDLRHRLDLALAQEVAR